MARGREKGLRDGSNHMAGGRGVSDGEREGDSDIWA